MERDEEICLCFHVTRRKLENFVRIHRPRHASQLSECFGAGTGCGWCRTYLRLILESADVKSESPVGLESALPTAESYAQSRRSYIRQGKGTPPPGDAAGDSPQKAP